MIEATANFIPTELPPIEAIDRCAKEAALANSKEEALNIWLAYDVQEPKQISIQTQIASLFFKLEDYSNAECYVQKALALNPDNFEAIHLGARIASKNANWSLAYTLWKKVLEAEPKHEKARETLTRISRKLSRQAKRQKDK